ncbi:Oidioi.mRNA.OKI2018_I69.XSR.g15084.t1.cds [Oikopleura dioica]|uniref:mRNA export factor GLE1 n=1 Tax=Oikopleura dioica TaxID=34765 RepID=A0ABN7SGS7_OIKDI|nr:Oidioi.mRNA.OKI2018_I69.XSR.g15084.t1.cds [Oikopleura dioica]
MWQNGQPHRHTYRDIPILLEMAEDEALHTEKIKREKLKRISSREADTAHQQLNTGESGKSVNGRYGSILASPENQVRQASAALRKIWRKSNENSFSLNAVEADVLSKSSFKNSNTLQELDNVYNKRLPARVNEFSAEYQKGIATEEAARENKLRQAEQNYKKEIEAEQQRKAAEEQRINEQRLQQQKIVEQAAEKRQREEAELRAKLDAQKPEAQQQNQEVARADPTQTERKEKTPVELDRRLEGFLSRSQIEEQIKLWEDSCRSLIQPKTDSDKQIAMKIKRMIAVPIGALTQRSGEDLKIQIKKIGALLDGKELPNHPETAAFSILCASQRMVRLAEEQLSSNEKAACAAAAAVIALWDHDSNFGQLFMAHLYLACPILLPRDPQPVDIDETRMRSYVGYARLITCMASSDCAPGKDYHPFGIENLWKILASILLLPTGNELGPHVVYEILRYSGKRLSAYYNNAFSQLLAFIYNHYIPTATGGPAARLSSILDEVDQKGWQDPPGNLASNFWTTKDEMTGKIVDH